MTSPFDMAETLHAVENAQTRKGFGATFDDVATKVLHIPPGILERCLNQLEREGFIEVHHNHYTTVRKGEPT